MTDTAEIRALLAEVRVEAETLRGVARMAKDSRDQMAAAHEAALFDRVADALQSQAALVERLGKEAERLDNLLMHTLTEAADLRPDARRWRAVRENAGTHHGYSKNQTTLVANWAAGLHSTPDEYADALLKQQEEK
jgi:hypothetical protein